MNNHSSYVVLDFLYLGTIINIGWYIMEIGNNTINNGRSNFQIKSTRQANTVLLHY
jgi:hypothetical protein